MSDPSITDFPSPINDEAVAFSADVKKARIAEKMEEILKILGLDLSHPSIAKTPERIAQMYVDEIFLGLDRQNFPLISFMNEEIPQELVVIKNISLVSFCEHHFVPMTGVAHVAYFPKERILGFSKIHHIVRYFAARPQLQERLTAQIADSLSTILETEDVAVSIEAQHLCVVARDVEDTTSVAETHIMRGRFESDPQLRNEWLLRVGAEDPNHLVEKCTP